MNCVRPSLEFINRCVAVRLSLDDALEGDLLVVPGSHRNDDPPMRDEAISVPVQRGGVLVMRPSLVHGSTKLEECPSRRVLHFLYASPKVPDSYHWSHAV